MKIKILPEDILFSNYIRTKAKWKCEYCGRVCRTPNGQTKFYKLEASHYHSRGHWSTRFDPENVVALCFTCHQKLGGYKQNTEGPYDIFMKERLDEKGWKLLLLRANTSPKTKYDPVMTKLYINQLMKELPAQKRAA